MAFFRRGNKAALGGDTMSPEEEWLAVSHYIMSNCKPLSDRVIAEGVRLMLTDTDWETLRGFEIVSQRAGETELLSICVAAGLSRKQYDALLDLYNTKKRSKWEMSGW
jgi:hypothetical protein